MSKSKKQNSKFDMTDWEIVKPESKSNENVKFNMNDWEVIKPENKGNEETFLQKLPRNLQIGLFNQRQNAVNLPHDIAQGLEEVGNKFGVLNKTIPLEKYIGNNRLPFSNENNQPRKNISEYLPYEQNDYAKLLGQTGEPTFADTLIQKGVEHAPEIIGGLNALRNILPHLTRRGASRRLRQARQLGIEREIGPLNVNPELIEDLRQYQPANTLPYRNQMDTAHTGNYQGLFDLQSDVGKAAAEDAKWRFNSTSATRRHGREGLNARNALIEDMHRALNEAGHNDISNLLRQGQEDYRRYAKFRPYRNAIGAAAATAAAAQLLPKNALINLIQKLATMNNH